MMSDFLASGAADTANIAARRRRRGRDVFMLFTPSVPYLVRRRVLSSESRLAVFVRASAGYWSGAGASTGARVRYAPVPRRYTRSSDSGSSSSSAAGRSITTRPGEVRTPDRTPPQVGHPVGQWRQFTGEGQQTVLLPAPLGPRSATTSLACALAMARAIATSRHRPWAARPAAGQLVLQPEVAYQGIVYREYLADGRSSRWITSPVMPWPASLSK